MPYTPAYGRLPKTPDRRDYRARAPYRYTGQFVDLSGRFPQPPYDQGQLGSCVSNAVAGAVDFALAAEGKPPLGPPSRLFVYWNGRKIGGYPINQDTGLQVRDGFQVIAKLGAPPESDWPYDIARFTEQPPAQAFTDARLDEAVKFGAVDQGGAVDDMIASGYPVAFGFDVYESFESRQAADTGVIPVPDTRREQNIGGHCMLLVSTPVVLSTVTDDRVASPTARAAAVPGKAYRKARNSWGHDGSWGIPEQPGYAWLPSDITDSSESSDFWQVTTVSDPNGPTPPDPTPTPTPQPADTDAPFREAVALVPALDTHLARTRARRPELNTDTPIRDSLLFAAARHYGDLWEPGQ